MKKLLILLLVMLIGCSSSSPRADMSGYEGFTDENHVYVESVMKEVAEKMDKESKKTYPWTARRVIALIGIILLLFANRKESSDPYIVVLRCDGQDAEIEATAFLKNQTKRCVVKSKTVRKDDIEVDYEIRLKEDDTSFINELSDMEGVKSAVLVSFNGEYAG